MNWQWIATNWPKIADLALTHVQIALPPIAVAFLVALPVGWVAHRHARVRDVLVGAASLLYVVPSLALFVALPLVLGTSVLSPVNVVVALSLYGIALQVRSTADAFDTVPTSTREAATAGLYRAAPFLGGRPPTGRADDSVGAAGGGGIDNLADLRRRTHRRAIPGHAFYRRLPAQLPH